MVHSTLKYRFIYPFARFTVGLIHRGKVQGREKIPEGPAIIFSNHCHWSDPLLLIFMLGRFDQICFMAKAELFRSPFLRALFRAIGTFSVKRGAGDGNALDEAVARLKEGKKVGIFPEGTRTKVDGEMRPRGGFLRIADRAEVPLVPVYLERERSLFKPAAVIVGDPISVDELRDAETGRINYPRVARELMDRIWALKADYFGAAKAAE